MLATAHVPCRDGISYHAVLRADHELLVYTDGKPLFSAYTTLALTGQLGVGGCNIPIENGIADMNVAPLVPKVPHFDRPHTIEISAPANSAQFRWPEANNVNIGWYVIRRDGQVLGRSTIADWTDTGLSANTSYTYSIQAFSLQGQPDCLQMTCWSMVMGIIGLVPLILALRLMLLDFREVLQCHL